MIDLGTVRPGSTIRIPFSSFDKDDGSSITMTNFAAADVLIYKDGGTTDRGTGGGITATTDFDTKTGKHLAIIDLADDATTADFFKAGSEYLVAIDAVTVDAVTTGGWIARFRIGYPNAYFDTSIATLASQTSFTLTAGPAEDDALNGMVLLVHDKASAIQVTRVVVEDYTGATKTVTLRALPATTFTIAAGDNVSGIGFDTVNLTHAGGTAVSAWSATRGLAGTALPAAAADAAGGLAISDAGGLDLDAKIGALTYTVANKVDANATHIGGAPATAEGAGVSVPTTLASRTNITGGTMTTTTNVTNGVTLAASAVQAIWDALTTALTTVGSIGKKLADWVIGTAQTGDSFARIGATGSGLTSLASQASVDDLPTNAELATALASADDATLAAIAALPTAAATAAAIMDLANGIETNVTPREAMRIILAGIAGILSGAATTTVVCRNVGNSKDRITATVDADGNRSAVTVDGT